MKRVKSQKGSIVLILMAIIVVVVIANAGLWYYIFKIKPNTIPSVNLPGTSQVSTQPTLVPTILPTSIPTFSPTGVSDEDGIKAAFAKKYNKPISDISVSISKKDATHVWGTVKFAGDIAGGWFLAFKEATGWIIVADGNGVILCKDIQPFNFPVSMVEECVDQNGKVVKR